jgi:hypothetical protein
MESRRRVARPDKSYLLLNLDLVAERLGDRSVSLRTRMKTVAADE